MRYLHYAHLLSRLVVKNQKVTRGQLIGRVGRTGNALYAHCHFEDRKDLYGGFHFYPTASHSKAFIMAHYGNPGEYFALPGVGKAMNFDHLGYGFLSWTGKQYHPGWDLNRGAGNTDSGDPVYATESGIILDSSFVTGWGNGITLEPRILGITDEMIKDLFRKIWGKEPAYGDWYYFRVRMDVLNNIDDTVEDLTEKVEYTFGKWKELGDRWWQNEKDKVL